MALCFILVDYEKNCKWFVSHYLFKAIKKPNGLTEKGEYVTLYHPQSSNTSDKIGNLLVCWMAKNKLSIYVSDIHRNHVHKGETLHITE